MSAPQPPTLPPPTPSERSDFARAQHTLSLGLLVACPLLIILPPRKLDLYTFSLSTAWLISANHVVAQRSGKSILANIGDARWIRGGDGLPSDKAREVRERLRREREGPRAKAVGVGGAAQRSSQAGGEEEPEGGVVALSKKLWMGSEPEDWKEKRLREEREALEGGKGYAGLIMDQIWEVLDWGKKGEDGDGEG